MQKTKFDVKLREYIDAQVPIIYIDSFDDNKIEEMVLQVTGSRRVWEWNEMDGCINRKKVENDKWTGIHEVIAPERTLYDLLREGVRHEELNKIGRASCRERV